MLPKTHIILGAIFSIIIWIIFPEINLIYLSLIFLSSFLIDVDHYLAYVFETKNLSLKKAFDYHIMLDKLEIAERAKGIKRKGPFHVFHTFEFLLAVYLVSLIWTPILYILIGMLFHSALDIISLINLRTLYRREFFLTNWIIKKF
ncbi:MAG: hypothetical protein AABX85_03560 [Nanoarchaeota archaeon]